MLTEDLANWCNIFNGTQTQRTAVGVVLLLLQREPCTLMTFKYSFPYRSPGQIAPVKLFRAVLVHSVNWRFRFFLPCDLYTRFAD